MVKVYVIQPLVNEDAYISFYIKSPVFFNGFSRHSFTKVQALILSNQFVLVEPCVPLLGVWRGKLYGSSQGPKL